MSTVKLTNPTDDELSAAVAEHVAGWTYQTFPNGACPHIQHWRNAKGEHTSIYTDGRFSTSADAVLPLLEKCDRWRADQYEPNLVWVDLDAPKFGSADAPTFARAACIALLRANGIEVEITP